MSDLPSQTDSIFYYSKYLSLALALVGIPIMLLDSASGSEMPLVVALFILLISTQKIDDERSLQIKTTFLYIAFILAYAVKLITSNLYDHSLVAFELVEINHFLILTLGIANAIFYGRLYILKN